MFYCKINPSCSVQTCFPLLVFIMKITSRDLKLVWGSFVLYWKEQTDVLCVYSSEQEVYLACGETTSVSQMWCDHINIIWHVSHQVAALLLQHVSAVTFSSMECFTASLCSDQSVHVWINVWICLLLKHLG